MKYLKFAVLTLLTGCTGSDVAMTSFEGKEMSCINPPKEFNTNGASLEIQTNLSGDESSVGLDFNKKVDRVYVQSDAFVLFKNISSELCQQLKLGNLTKSDYKKKYDEAYKKLMISASGGNAYLESSEEKLNKIKLKEVTAKNQVKVEAVGVNKATYYGLEGDYLGSFVQAKYQIDRLESVITDVKLYHGKAVVPTSRIPEFSSETRVKVSPGKTLDYPFMKTEELEDYFAGKSDLGYSFKEVSLRKVPSTYGVKVERFVLETSYYNPYALSNVTTSIPLYVSFYAYNKAFKSDS
ncbi:hypothetical protein ACN5ZZ_004698 [Vibrio parahaemolyticus]